MVVSYFGGEGGYMYAAAFGTAGNRLALPGKLCLFLGMQKAGPRLLSNIKQFNSSVSVFGAQRLG